MVINGSAWYRIRSSNAATSNTTVHFVAGYDVALGVRWAPHPMFALGLEGGLFGLFADVTPNGQPTQRVGITAVYGALAGTFFYDFGK